MNTATSSMIPQVFVCVLAVIAFPIAADAQALHAYVGGTLDLATQTESDSAPLGGTMVGGRALIGVQVSPRVSVDFEPSFAGAYSSEYSYRPTPSDTANVVASRRNTFFTGQARLRFGVIEPVVGLSYIRGEISRHATIGSTTYFDDSGSDSGLAVVGGLDAAIPFASHVFIVPTIRAFLTFTGGTSTDPLESQTEAGPILMRYGVGLRLGF